VQDETLLKHRVVEIDDYVDLIGEAAVERICRKAKPLADRHVVHVNSTLYGGGVSAMLDSLTLMMNSVGIKTGWRVIQGAPDFFSITKKMHNALQTGTINLSARKKEIYEDIVFKNSIRNHFHEHEYVIVHDPQPLPLIEHYRKNGPWIWRCHVDLSEPNPELWHYLTRFIEKYDAVIISDPKYKQQLRTPQRIFMPAIDPFAIVNKELSDAEVDERLAHYGIPVDLPLVAQISRFDRWKDPEGVIEAFKLAREHVEATLVLLGNIATDDPEGEQVYHSLLKNREDRILVIARDDTALVNALQRRAAVILQKSLREGFGLTVTEAMWKGAAVIGGKAGGIPNQIEHEINGVLVSSVPEAAEWLVRLLKDAKLRRRLGVAARKTVQEKFLMTRLLEQYIDLFSSFETVYKLH
jgi:trehalose synthase